MRHLNYSHLLYFWTVAREGSIARASALLHLTPQTISGQIKLLEESTGVQLLQRKGRGLALTPMGELVKQYGDEIFMLGAELTQRLKSEEPGTPAKLNVGIVSSLPKLVSYRMLEPALHADDGVRLVCREGNLEELLAELAILRLDLVLSDRPVPAELNVKAYNHELGQSEVAFFVHKRRAAKLRRDFPESLHGAAMLMPVASSALRRQLDDWFDANDLQPEVVAEFDDSALLKAFGEAGQGIFPAPTAIEQEVTHMYRCSRIGTARDVTERYFAISPERRISHPAILKITEAARARLAHKGRQKKTG